MRNQEAGGARSSGEESHYFFLFRICSIPCLNSPAAAPRVTASAAMPLRPPAPPARRQAQGRVAASRRISTV